MRNINIKQINKKITKAIIPKGVSFKGNIPIEWLIFH